MKTPPTFLHQLDTLIEQQPAHVDMLGLLTAHFQLSPSQIYRKIKYKTGLSPSHYVRQKRLALAKELIEQSDLTLTEIAEMVGFQRLSYFSRCFSDYFGVTPSSLRK